MKPKFLTLKIQLDVDGDIPEKELDNNLICKILDNLGGGVCSEEFDKDDDSYILSYESVEWNWEE